MHFIERADEAAFEALSAKLKAKTCFEKYNENKNEEFKPSMEWFASIAKYENYNLFLEGQSYMDQSEKAKMNLRHFVKKIKAIVEHPKSKEMEFLNEAREVLLDLEHDEVRAVHARRVLRECKRLKDFYYSGV